MFNTFGAEALVSRGKSGQSPKVLVHQVSDWCSGVAIKMGRRQGATREHI
jgi:hypothetical protein